MSRLARTVIVLALLLSAATPARAEWTQLQTPNFLLIGEVSEREMRESARTLEQFRALLVRLTPSAMLTPPVPTVVLLFAGERSFAPYRPRRDGRPQDNVPAYFQAGDTLNYIVMNGGGGRTALRLAMHEYTHFLIANRIGSAPAWLSEGLAQFYETVEVYDGGRAAMVGAALAQHIQLLNEVPLLTIDRLIRVEDTLAIEHPRARSLFYSQSWALVHYLTLANQTRARQLQAYADRIGRGEPPAEAFVASFGDDTRALEGELAGYVRQLRFTARRYTLNPPLIVTVPNARRIADAEAQAHLADLLFRMQLVDDARAALEKLVRADAGNTRAAASLGWLELSSSRFDVAIPLLERAAAALPGDGAMQAALGDALYQQAHRAAPSRDVAATLLRRADAVLTAALALSPDNVTALTALARVEMLAGADLARARTLLTRAIAVAPARVELHIDLAEVQIRQGDVAAAAATLTPLTRHATHEQVRAAAIEMLAELSGEPAQVERAAPRLALRVVGEGEQRIAGRFTRLECAPNMMLLHIQTEAGTLALQEVIGGAQFINFRPGSTLSLSCGPVAGQPSVLATYRPWTASSGGASPGNAGIALAIEFVPDGYVPP